MTGTNKHKPIEAQCLASLCALQELILGSNLIATPAQQVEACLVDIVGDILRGDNDIFLIEDALVASNESVDLCVLTQQTVDDVVSSWALPAIEANTNLNLLVLTALTISSKGDNLMAFL